MKQSLEMTKIHLRLPATPSSQFKKKKTIYVYRNFILNEKNPQIFHKVKYLENQLKNLIKRRQEKYYLCI